MTKATGGAPGRPMSETVVKRFPAKPIDSTPKKPIGLQVAGKKAWEDVWKSGRVEETEASLVSEYCFLIDEVAAARKLVKTLANPWHAVGTNGALQPHPAVQNLKDLRQLLLTFQRELIMSPASRVKANLEIEKQSDKLLEDFVKRSQARRATQSGS